MMSSNNLALALLLASGGAFAFPANSSSYINVHIPRTLHKNSTDGTWGYPHTRGHIGTSSSHLPPTGSMSLNIHLADTDICKTVEKRPPPGHIILADRGNCSFTTQARNAQMAGAAAVLFADTHCLCSDVHCAATQGENDTSTCEAEEPAVVDDGSGGDVSIPTFLLRKPGADEIKDVLKKKTPVLLDIHWHPPQNTHSINYTIWMDPLDNSTKDLLKEFKPIDAALGSKAAFTPRYLIHNGSLSHCEGNTGEDGACRDMCTNNGRYCYPSEHIPGSAVVAESLRRMCIWEHHGQDDKDGIIGLPWWEYVTYFNDHCSNINATFADPKCIDEAYAHAKVSAEDVKQCMADSGGIDGDAENRLLDQAIEEKGAHGVYITPTVHINHQTLSWTASAAPAVGMMETICGGFETGHIPEVCTRCLGAKDVVSCAASDDHHGGDDDDDDDHHGGDHHAPKKESHAFRNFMIFFVLAGAVGGAGFYVYKMRDSHTDSSWNLRYAMLGDNDSGGDRI